MSTHIHSQRKSPFALGVMALAFSRDSLDHNGNSINTPDEWEDPPRDGVVAPMINGHIPSSRRIFSLEKRVQHSAQQSYCGHHPQPVQHITKQVMIARMAQQFVQPGGTNVSCGSSSVHILHTHRCLSCSGHDLLFVSVSELYCKEKEDTLSSV